MKACIISTVLLLLCITAYSEEPAPLRSGSIHLAPDDAGLAEVVSLPGSPKRREKALLGGAKISIVGISTEFGALCYVDAGSPRAGVGRTPARQGEYVWIDPNEITDWEGRRRRESERAKRMEDEVKRLLYKQRSSPDTNATGSQ